MPETTTERQVADWPYPEASDRTRWHEITEEHYEYFRDVLPPARYWVAGFLIGEPANHDPDGVAIRACCQRIARMGHPVQFFLREIREKETDIRAAIGDLWRQITSEEVASA